LLAEGPQAVAEAFRYGAHVTDLFVTVPARSRHHDLVAAIADAGIPIHVVSGEIMDELAQTVTPQGLLAVCGFVDVPLTALTRPAPALVALLANVRDPGNAGTVLRSAEAAGAGGVVCCDGSVDLFNPKAVRASAGSLFFVPVVLGGEPVAVLETIGGWGIRRLGAVARGGRDYTTMDLTAPVAFVVGNEAHGLPREIEALLDDRITVPLAGRSESLNVGMATAVLCFEAARQRRAEA
jgi:TrmH family RNA methyltransferase